MRRLLKSFTTFSVIAMLLLSFCISVGAVEETHNSQDGLVASITTKKDSYQSNEDIDLTFKVTNTNDFAVENVSLEAIIPDGLTLKKGDNTSINTVSLASGESLELALTVVKESSVIVVPIETTNPNIEKPTETKPLSTENTTAVQTESVQATTTKANLAVSTASDSNNSNGPDNSSIKTGNNTNYILIGLICLISLAVAVLAFRFRNKAVKYLSLALCVCISVSSIAVVGVTNTNAQEAKQQMSFNVSKTITVDNVKYSLLSNTRYEFAPNISLSDFKANIFDIYLNDEKTVTFTCKVNSNMNIAEKDVAVYNDNNFIAYMNDNGINGDSVANDGIYSVEATLSSTEFALKKYHATAFDSNSNTFEINFYRELTSEEFTSFDELHTNIENMSFSEASEYIKQSNEMDTYFIDKGNQIITYTTKYHITGIWEQEKGGTFKGNGELSIPTSYGRDYEKSKQLVNKYHFTSELENKNIIVLRPFRHTEFLYDDFKHSGELLSSALNSDVVIKDDENVTLSDMKTLNNYGIVLIDSHGTLVNGKKPHIVIGEKYQKDQRYSADYSSGRICVTSNDNLTIGSQFIETYYKDKSLINTFLFLGACYSGYLNDIPSSLYSLGAEAVVGFSDTVSVQYCNNVLFEIIINSMVLSKDTLKNGVQLAKNYYGNYDPYNSKCEITTQGNISYKIINEIADVLYGTVQENKTGIYLSNVRVDAYLKEKSDLEYVGNTYTDDKGNFSMGLQSGSYELRFNKDGYKTATTTVKISKDVMTVLKDPIVMETNVDWKQLYIDYINKTNSAYDYSLIYLNSDDIPELCLTGRYTMAGDILCWINNGSVQEETALGNYGTSYIEKEGLLLNTGGRQGTYFDKVFSFNGKNLELKIDGKSQEVLDDNSTYDFIYYINGDKVTKAEYNNKIDSIFDKSKSIKVSNKTYSKEEITEIIKNM